MSKTNDPIVINFKRGLRLLIITDETISNDFVAVAAGLTPNYVTRFLNTKSGLNPQISSLVALAGVFDMTIEDVARYAQAVDLVKLQLISGGQEEPLKHLLYMRLSHDS